MKETRHVRKMEKDKNKKGDCVKWIWGAHRSAHPIYLSVLWKARHVPCFFSSYLPCKITCDSNLCNFFPQSLSFSAFWDRMGKQLNWTNTAEKNHNSCCGSFHSFFSRTRAQLQLLLRLPHRLYVHMLVCCNKCHIFSKHDRNFNVFFALLSEKEQKRTSFISFLCSLQKKMKTDKVTPLFCAFVRASFLWLVFDFPFGWEFSSCEKNKKGASLSLSLACLENAMDGEKSTGQHTVIFFFPLVFFFLFKLIELHLHKKGRS